MNNFSSGLAFNLNSLSRFDQDKHAELLLSTFIKAPKEFVPVQYGRDELNMLAFDFKDITNAKRLLTSMRPLTDSRIKTPNGLLLLKASMGVEYLIHWRYGSDPGFTGVSGHVPWRYLDTLKKIEMFLGFVKEIVSVVNPVYGDLQNTEHQGWDNPLDLRKRLPDIPWISIYGEPYVEMFTKGKILTAPFWKIEKLSSGHFFLQAKESPFESVPEDLKASIRQHLGENAFMSRGRWRYKEGQAPAFKFDR